MSPTVSNIQLKGKYQTHKEAWKCDPHLEKTCLDVSVNIRYVNMYMCVCMYCVYVL